MKRILMLFMVSGMIFLLTLAGQGRAQAQAPWPIWVDREVPLAPTPVKANGPAVDTVLGELAGQILAPAQYCRVTDDLVISEQGGAWELPRLFGSTGQPFNSTITIGPNGISIGGVQTFSLPDLTWDNIQIKQNTAQVIFLADNKLQIDLTSGEMQVYISGGGSGVAHNVKLRLDENSIRRGDIDSFAVSGFAGLELQLDKTTIANGKLQVAETGIKAPKAWGGTEVALQGLSITNDGKVTISSGHFRLPEINASGDAFTLSSLEGEVRSLPGGGYAISALGKVGVTQFSSPGNCTVWVDATLDTGANNASLLSIQAAEDGQTMVTTAAAQQNTTPLAPAGLRLHQLMLDLRCFPGWAIGTTGLFLTGIEGTFQPAALSEQSSVKVWID